VRKHPALLISLFLVCLTLSWPVRDVGAATSAVVLSEVYGGGGNSQALYANDYVELFNRTRNPIDLTGWSVGYSSHQSATWRSVQLTGSIRAYHYYLVRLGSAGGGGTASLPAPDVSGSVNIARTAGKVRIMSPSGVHDLLGYGEAPNDSEGTPQQAPDDNKLSITRIHAGCTDTDRNDKDFVLRTPSPRNKASSGYACTQAPVLAPIGAKKVNANQALAFTVAATDPERDPLTYSAAPLPAGSRFTPSTRTFEWEPTQEQVGDHRVTFKVSDGYRSDSETVTITVSPDPYAGRSEITLTVTTEPSRLVGRGSVTPSHPGSVVTAKLLRYESGGYRRVAAASTTLDANSAYRVAFARPKTGRCIFIARFAGDDDHPPARGEKAQPC
jgi:hypothetical protein